MDCRTGGRLAFASSRHVVVVDGVGADCGPGGGHGCGSVGVRASGNCCFIIVGWFGRRNAISLWGGGSSYNNAVVGGQESVRQGCLGYGVNWFLGSGQARFLGGSFGVCAALAVTGSLAVHGADVCAGGQGLLVGGFAGSLAEAAGWNGGSETSVRKRSLIYVC